MNAWFQAPQTPPEFDPEWLMVVANDGDATIYQWEAAVWWVRTGPPGSGPHFETISLTAHTAGPLPPRSRRTQPLVWSAPTPEGRIFPESPARDFRVSITWQDPDGERWWLRYGGDLLVSNDRWPLPWSIRGDPPQLPDLDALARRATTAYNSRRRLPNVLRRR